MRAVGGAAPLRLRRARTLRTRILLGLAAIIALSLLFAAFSCARQASDSIKTATEATSTGSTAYRSPYDWSLLDRDSALLSYRAADGSASRAGIDVSENQQAIDWNQVKQAGVDFAFVRIGYRGSTAGELYEDAFYADNLSGAQEAGLDVGAYFFSQAITEEEAREEARFVLDRVAGRQLSYPIAFDSEVVASRDGRTEGLSNEQMTAIAEAFCAEIEAAGYEAMVYGNATDLARYDRPLLAEQPVWFAQYQSAPVSAYPFAIWQYTHQGQIPGISTDVDLNIDLRTVNVG